MQRYLRHLNVLNALLSVALLCVIILFLVPALSDDEPAVSTARVVQAAASSDYAQEGSDEEQPPSPLLFSSVGEQNLFHPERIIPVEKPAPPPKPELVLYGTLITDEASLAYVEDKKNPRQTPGRGKRVSIMKKGESIGGFVLKEIGPDRIVLMRGDESMTVLLSEARSKGRSGGNIAPRGMQQTTPVPQMELQTAPMPLPPPAPLPVPR
jgi:type II secretory pathway component PulC